MEDFTDARLDHPQTPVPPRSEPIPLVRVKGSHREIGRQIGEDRAEQVRHSVENARTLLAQTYSSLELTWEAQSSSHANISPLPRSAIRNMSMS